MVTVAYPFTHTRLFIYWYSRIRKSCTNSTVFFITHRLSTVRNADLIVMIDQGSIVETGTHQELMDKKERYFALYRQQESS